MSITHRIQTFIQNNSKWRVFGVIVLLIIVLGTIASLLARATFIQDSIETRPRLAVVASAGTEAGKAVRQGAELYLRDLNAQGGLNGRQVELLAAEETEAGVQKVLADKRVVGVVGHLDAQVLRQMAPRYQEARLPVVSPLAVMDSVPGVLGLGLNPQEESRFIGNYARNIQKQRLMYVVRQTEAQWDAYVDPFVDVFKRFETPVREVLALPVEPSAQDYERVIKVLSDVDVGGVYLAVGPEVAARLVKAIRGIGNAIEIFGPSTLSRGDFQRSLRALSGPEAEFQAHGIITATPVLFDTANDKAQRFLAGYQQAFKSSPDWIATLGFEAAHRASHAGGPEKAPGALLGETASADSGVQLPVQMGLYNGDRLISAPVQLLPIAKGAGFNYIDALRQGRVLYVNDRFMFRTNVVYSGVVINEVAEVDEKKETAVIDFSIWFRYRGKFDPQDVEILNSVQPIKLDKPEEVVQTDDIQYRRYRIRQTMRLNFTEDPRAFGQHIAGIAFRHRTLNRNNLSYVVDVLSLPTGNRLLEDLLDRKVVKAGSNWLIESAWMSQNLARERGDGAPQYVGMTGEQPLFSVITMGVRLKPESVTARDLVSPEYFIYLAIFGLLGVIVATGLDTRRMGRYWAVQSWILRLMFWPALLMALGNLIVDWAFGHLLLPSTRIIVGVYESLWWLLGAWLADMAIRRFIWVPLEETTQRQVPNIMKFIVSLLVYGLGVAGITSMVFNQTLTNLLATSGLLAMIIGLAIKDNIANVFSGIVLNVERPFKVGDFIKINNMVGQVKDITWRTTRIESNDGPMVSMANSRVSEALTENYSNVPHGIAAETVFHTPAEVDHKAVLEIITEAIAKSKSIICKDVPGFDPAVRYRGIVNINGRWVAAFSAGYRVAMLPKKGKAREELWAHVREQFELKGIPLIPTGEEEAPVVVVEGKPA